jgi:hypothetical protein
MNKILIAGIAGALGLTALAAPVTASAGVHVGVGINLGYPGYYGPHYYGPRYYGGYYPAYYGGYYSPYYAAPPVVYAQPPVVVQSAPVVVQQQGPITECTRYPSGQEVCH